MIDLRAAKTGAKRLGITLEEYLGHRERGDLWCTGCRAWHEGELLRGRSGRCPAARSAYNRDYFQRTKHLRRKP